MVGDTSPPGWGAPPLVERGGEAHPVKNHVRETQRATSASPGLVRGEGALVKRGALMCAFDNAACHAAFMPCPVFEELRTAADQRCQPATAGIGPECPRNSKIWNP